MQPILGRTWLEWIRLSRIFRAPFANLSLEIVKKIVDTISCLVFRGSSANLSPTCTFLERYLSRRHFKSMPVDLDYIKPFMGFCTTLIYIYIYQYINIPCRSTPVFKTVFTKRLFYSANDCFPYPAASTPAIFFKSVCYVQLWPWFGSVKAASTCPRGSCLYFMRNWFKNESSAVNGAWIRVKAEWKEVLSRERRF